MMNADLILHKLRTGSDAPPPVPRNQIVEMTGWTLMGRVGIYDPERRTWRNNDERTFQDDRDTTWHIYSTSGRGKHSGTTYVHLYRHGQMRIVNPDGTDTGDRVPTVYHYRGRAQDRLGTYDSID